MPHLSLPAKMGCSVGGITIDQYDDDPAPDDQRPARWVSICRRFHHAGMQGHRIVPSAFCLLLYGPALDGSFSRESRLDEIDFPYETARYVIGKLVGAGEIIQCGALALCAGQPKLLFDPVEPPQALGIFPRL